LRVRVICVQRKGNTLRNKCFSILLCFLVHKWLIKNLTAAESNQL
jgi:hypothetical protein